MIKNSLANSLSPRCACYPKYRLLDLYCKAGGCSAGYVRAGFEVTGVDIEPQKNYPFAFVQADAIEYVKQHGHEYDAIHASPPCQVHSMASQQWRKAGKEYPDLIEPTREALKAIGKPYVIENVPGAPLISPIVLNGAMFGLKVRRVRLFECSGFDIPFTLLSDDAPSIFRMGRPIKEGDAITPVGHFSNIPYARKQMEIDWMTGAELTQAIPPAYTEWIGNHLRIALEDNVVLSRRQITLKKPTGVSPGRLENFVKFRRAGLMIKEAAIQRKADGKVWTGRRHGDCISVIVKEVGIRPVNRTDFIQGFVTDDERFVDRKEAWKIALANNQILNLKDPYGYDPEKPEVEGTLISEDLY